MSIIIKGPPHFVGSFPVRQDITVLPADPKYDIHDQVIIPSTGIGPFFRKSISLGTTIFNPILIKII